MRPGGDLAQMIEQRMGPRSPLASREDQLPESLRLARETLLEPGQFLRGPPVASPRAILREDQVGRDRVVGPQLREGFQVCLEGDGLTFLPLPLHVELDPFREAGQVLRAARCREVAHAGRQLFPIAVRGEVFDRTLGFLMIHVRELALQIPTSHDGAPSPVSFRADISIVHRLIPPACQVEAALPSSPRLWSGGGAASEGSEALWRCRRIHCKSSPERLA